MFVNTWLSACVYCRYVAEMLLTLVTCFFFDSDFCHQFFTFIKDHFDKTVNSDRIGKVTFTDVT